MTVSSFAQLVTVLFIFVLVLALTYYVTRWISRYQKTSGFGKNIELLETLRLNNTNYIQIVRIASKYLAIAVCKDSVTVLTELNEDEYEPPAVKQGEAPDFSKELTKVVERFKKK